MFHSRGLVEIDVKHPDEEVVRLHQLHAELEKSAPEVKRQVADDLLKITINPDEDLGVRTLACNNLNISPLQLVLDKSKVAARLRRALKKEFIVYRREGFLRLDINVKLRHVNFLQLILLSMLLSTLMRTDFQNSRVIVEKTIDVVTESQIKANLSERFACEMQKLAAGQWRSS